MKNILVLLVCLFTLLLNARELSAEQLNLYDIDSSLINHNNEKVRLDQFKGHPVLVTMIYASCPSACPATISKMKKIVGDLPKEAAKELRVLLISFDPERDTPKTLAKVINDHELDTSTWQLAIPEKQDDVRVLAAAITMNFRKIENGEFGHTSPVAIVDRKGNILHSAEITRDSEAEFVGSVKSLLAN